MLSVVYVSVADPGLSDADVAALFDRSRANNMRDGLTGALLYNGQNFLHLIEGDKRAVEACLGRICADRRHNGVTEIGRRDVDAREFSAFSAQYVPLFRSHDRNLAHSAAGDRLNPADERMVANFLALGNRGAAAAGEAA